jgi:phytanoyl-CoA hydroxylase
MTATMEPAAVPQIASAACFSAEERSAFERDGYVIARGLASPELCRRMLDVTRAGLAAHTPPVEYEADLHYPGAPQSREVTGGDTIRRLKEAHGRDPVFTQWVAHEPLVSRLQQLLGPRVVMPFAHHNCIMTKQPRFSSQTGWHQDIRYWSFARPELVSVWLALGRETIENGCLELIPGTHRMELSRDRLDDALFLRPDLPENASLIARKIAAPLEPGDVLFFHCRTFHAAGRNQTSETKFSVVFTFRPLDNPPIAGTRSAAPELLLPSVIQTASGRR